MGNEYLLKEYEIGFDQLRFYDERENNILKYLVSLTTAVATAQFAIFKYLQGVNESFFLCQLFLSVIVFIATLLFYLAMLQNRLYFVYTARQLNAIRGFLMKKEAPRFKDNQLYTAANFSALNPFSVHTFQLLCAVILSALFAGLSAFAFSNAVFCSSKKIAIAAVVLITAGVEIVGGIMFLSAKSKMNADEAIHGKIS